MTDSTPITAPLDASPRKRWLRGEITSGKFAELIAVPRHVGDDILFTAFQLKEDYATAVDHGEIRERLLKDELAALRRVGGEL